MAPPILFLISLVLFSILAHANDEYFTVGDLGQYTTDGVPTPVLTGSVIEFTAVGDPAKDGLLAFLSPDMQTNVKSAMDSNCAAEIDTKCYQEVLDVLEDSNRILKSRSLNQRALEPRQVDVLSAGAVLIAALLFPIFYKGDEVVPVPIKIPPEQLEDSFDLETATAIIVVTDNTKPEQTVTQPPEQDRATGLPATITTFASAGNGASAGDVGIELDSTVAAHLQALLSGSDTSNCEVGAKFFLSSSLWASSLDMTSVICGAEHILADSIGRDGYPNWLLMNQGRFPWTKAEVVAGLNTVVQWALIQARRLNPTISPSHLHGLAVGAFALSWAYFNNGAITINNVIPSASLQGGPSATVCQAQTATQCGVECGVQPWAPQFTCSTACSTVTSCDAQPALTTTLTTTMTAIGSDPTGSSSTGQGQQIAVASYINPLADQAAWNRLIEYPVKKMPILVANVMNGPDSAVDKNWADVIQRASSAGKTVLSYVRTGYLGVSDQKFQTRLGSGDLADWTAQIEEDVDIWYMLYGSNIGGIFFDEGWPECGDNNQYANLYKYINDYTKRSHPGAFTVLNPGSPIASCFEDTMDTLLTFELSYKAYTNSYTPNNWTPKDPRKLWHILTDNTLPNPYDTLPGDSYIQSMIGAIKGGSPLNTEASSWLSGSAAGAVSGLSILTSDYTSAKLSWNAALNALGYYVYSGNSVIASVPSSMTTITIGGLQPGASHTFHVSAVGGDGYIGSSSNTDTADILVPYAFIRLYIWNSVGCEFDTDPGWSVNFKIDEYVCTHYMVEGTTLYRYSGTLPEGSTAPPWAWSVVGPITLNIKDYTYKWTLPLGTSTIDTSKFVIQAQGYNPLTNVFEPDPSAYDCKGSSMCTTPDFLKWCDHAVNTLQRNDDLFYFATLRDNETGINQSGNCWGDQTRGCGVFIQGDASCSISGNDLWNDYQNIRNIGGCSKCGSFHREDGCLITINYVYQCDNHG
ncbi:Spherulation-specific family 4-domain-containing protein [Aspergillus alliaceus]|uniref:Spherulation-specific family 4-domain-containing protein n=1 Tax=Petromyces alliaceus TaxID=209559 RepID=A0A5N7CN15_PETAA|nr:Spherulation-specific family 4-domain-containing protein [Aspergillus alliaceus]